jgi:phage gp46-like protein
MLRCNNSITGVHVMTALLEPSTDTKALFVDPQKALALPIGVASPLWLMFAGAASAGVAYWWLNRWRTMTNLEAVMAPALAAPEALAALAAPEVVETVEVTAEVVEATVLEPVMDAAEEVVSAPVIEAAPEPVVEALPEAVIEAEPEPVVEAVAESVIEAAPEPAIEAAPQAVVEAAPAPRPRPKPKTKAAAVRAAPRTTSGPTRRS